MTTLRRSRKFYSDNFEVTLGDVHKMRVTGLNVAFGLDIETKHNLPTSDLAGKATLELDDFRRTQNTGRCATGKFRRGSGFSRLEVDSLDGVNLPFRGEMIQRDGPLYRGPRAATIVGSAGEWIELIERS